MIFEHSSYRDYLKAVLAERVGKNPKYSLRAMAGQLSVAPSSLSEVLNGHKNISLETALMIAAKTKLKDKEVEYFCLLVQAESEKNPVLKDVFIRRINELRPSGREKVRDVSVDQFKLIADWYHLATLELTRVDSFEFTPSNIAQSLKISENQAEVAIARLERLGLIERNAHGNFQKVEKRLQVNSPIPNEALRSFHKQMLEKAIDSLETQKPAEKVVGSETFAIAPEKVEEARILIDEFFERMLKLTHGNAKATDVFHLGVQFFSLTGVKNINSRSGVA